MRYYNLVYRLKCAGIKCLLTIYVMKQHVDILVMLVAAFLMLTKPQVLVDLAQTTLGKLALLLAVVGAALHSTMSGLLVAAVFIYLSESVFEGMSSSAATPVEKAQKLQEDYDKILELRKEHCKKINGEVLFTDANGNVLTLDEIKKKYPHLSFDDKTCTNPCDDGCSIQITEGMEQLTTEESLRPKQSRQHATARDKDFVQEGFKNIM